MSQKNLENFPSSQDVEFWDGETNVGRGNPVTICSTHTKESWSSEVNKYVNNHDGSISCQFCPWGTRLPGYMRLIDGKILDFRILNGAQVKA